MSIAVFSRIVFAVATAPKSHPARVNGTHGAGAILPFSLIISGIVSLVLPPWRCVDMKDRGRSTQTDEFYWIRRASEEGNIGMFRKNPFARGRKAESTPKPS
jgi:hypothetical protein